MSFSTGCSSRQLSGAVKRGLFEEVLVKERSSMLRNPRWYVVVGILILFGGGSIWLRVESSDVLAQTVPGPGTLRIAVVDLERVFDSSPKKKALEAALETEYREKSGVVAGMEKEIKGLQQEMTLVNPGSPEHNALSEQVALKLTRKKLYEERSEGELIGRRLASFDEVYTEVKAVVASVAVAERFDLVLQRRLVIQEGSPPWDSVLYANDALDITDVVVARITEGQR